MNTGIRAKGTALSSMSAWMSNFIIGQVSPIAFRNIGWKYYLVFAVCGFTNALTMWALYPETRGRSLEMMDSYFEETGWIVPLSKNGKGGIPPRDAESESGVTRNRMILFADAAQLSTRRCSRGCRFQTEREGQSGASRAIVNGVSGGEYKAAMFRHRCTGWKR